MNFLHLAAAMCALTSPGSPSETTLLDFGADWCGYCRQMEPVLNQLGAEGFPVRKVNVDHDHALAEKYGVQGLPCFIMLVNGKEVDRVVGATDRARLVAMFTRNGVEPGAGNMRRPRLDIAAADPVPFPRTDVEAPGMDEARELPAHPSIRPVAGDDEDPADAAAPRTRFSAADSVYATSAHDDLIRSSVRLRIEDSGGISCGSGTIIDARKGEALIITCGHMFREADRDSRILVDLFGPGAPQGVPGRLIDFDLKSEIGVLSIQTDYPLRVARVAALGYNIRRGDQVISVGCDGGADATAKETIVKSINRYSGPANLQVGFQPVQGRSGGGLFTADGLVIGVCNAGDPEDNEGEFAHLSVVQNALDRLGLGFVYRDASGQQAAGGRQQAAGSGLSVREDRSRQRAPSPPPSPKGRGRTWRSAACKKLRIRQPAARSLTADQASEPISADEQTAIDAIREKSQGAEVICIVRPLGDPKAKSDIIVLDRVSPGFMKHLVDERETQPARQLTSLEIPRTAHSPSVPAQFQLEPWWSDLLRTK